ncbi:MAG: hypothetical protein MRJ93_12055 [Nitrososphaeraceae archaeon]|nr:hypothetical protein [Nitrososphaeraceae archaeon]
MKEGTKLELKRQRIKEWKMQVKQRKQLIEISPETLTLFKNASALMNANTTSDIGTFDDILRRVLKHWLYCDCTDIEIDNY